MVQKPIYMVLEQMAIICKCKLVRILIRMNQSLLNSWERIFRFEQNSQQ